MRFVSYVSLYLRKALSSLLQSPFCFSQLIRKFHSCLCPHLPACPCALGISLSRQQSLYGALLLYCLSQTPLPPLNLCCQSQLLLLLHHPLQADRKVSFCQARYFLPAREEGARARPWGASTLPSPCSYPNSVPNPN